MRTRFIDSPNVSEIVYSDEYEDFICKVCRELLPGTAGFRFCPFCGRPFMPRERREKK